MGVGVPDSPPVSSGVSGHTASPVPSKVPQVPQVTVTSSDVRPRLSKIDLESTRPTGCPSFPTIDATSVLWESRPTSLGPRSSGVEKELFPGDPRLPSVPSPPRIMTGWGE